MPASILVNGVIRDTVSATDRGLAYGDGLFETLSVNCGRVEFLPEHLQRLEAGCHRLSLDFDGKALRADIDILMQQASSVLLAQAVVKIILTRGGEGRGYRPDPAAATSRIVMLSAAPEYNASAHPGVSVRVCDTRLSINPALAGLKHLSRLEQVMARNEWRESTVSEGLMLDTAGHLVEGTMSNIFLLSNDRLKTPELSRCGVAGVVRRLVIERLAPSLSIEVQQCDLYMDDLISADSVFLTNSLIGIWPVANIGCHHKRVDSTVTHLQKALEHLRSV